MLEKNLIIFFVLISSLNATFLNMPKNYSPKVDNIKKLQNAQKEFTVLCLKPTISQLKTLKLIKHHSLCGISELPSKEGCRDIINCYLSEYVLNSMYKLSVDNSELSDLSPIAFFKSPRTFLLGENNISDISYLSGLDNIIDLSLVGNPIEDISALKDLEMIGLYINDTPLKDLSPLGEMISLHELSIGDNIEDIEVLKNLKNLKRLSIESKHTIDICQIKNLSNLEFLTIVSGGIRNIDCLTNYPNLISLTLKDMQLKDISVVANYSKLKYLTLKNVPVKDISMIKDLKVFRSIGLVNTKVEDVSVLTYMENNGRDISIGYGGLKSNPLVRCSPKNEDDISVGKSCYEKNGELKSFWKRWLGL